MTPHHPISRLRALQDRATGLFLEATQLHRAYLTRHILPGHPARAALLAYQSRPAGLPEPPAQAAHHHPAGHRPDEKSV